MISQEYQLRSRVSWIIWFRLAFLGVMSTSALSLSIFYSESVPANFYPLVWAGIIWSLFSLLCLHFFRSEAFIQSLAWLQLLVDGLIVSYIVFQTGVSQSAFYVLYGLNLITAGIALLSSGVIVASLFSVVSYLGLSFFAFGHFAAPPPEEVSRLVFQLSALLLAGALIAWLFRNRSYLIRSLEKTENDLRNLSRIQSILVEHIPSGVVVVDADEHILFANQVAVRILDQELKGLEIGGSPLNEFLNRDRLSEIKFKSQSGEEKLIRGIRLSLEEGMQMIVFDDLTHIKELESQLRYREKLASVGQLAAGLAHEIKNPLASLSGSIELLKSDLKLEATHERLMNIVMRETDRLDHLLQSFLNYAKPSQAAFTKVSFSQIVEDVVLLEQGKKDSSIRWVLEVEENLDLLGDAEKLKQVVWNLVKNAEEAVADGGEICIRAFSLGHDHIRFEVQDSGRGIPKTMKDRIFEPFFTSRERGTGLGLALVYQIVDAHEADLGFESEEGQGALFWVEFKKKSNRNEGKSGLAA